MKRKLSLKLVSKISLINISLYIYRPDVILKILIRTNDLIDINN